MRIKMYFIFAGLCFFAAFCLYAIGFSSAGMLPMTCDSRQFLDFSLSQCRGPVYWVMGSGLILIVACGFFIVGVWKFLKSHKNIPKI